MAKGSLLHTLILEPVEFNQRYAIFDGARRAGDAWKSFQEANQEKEILKQSEYDEVKQIADRVRNNILIKKLTGVEQLIEFEVDKVPFKGYVDGYGDGFIMDLKSCQDASPTAFMRDIVKFKYYWQAALYLKANRSIKFAGNAPDYFILAIETKAPFNFQIYKLDGDFIDAGLKQVKAQVQAFKEWDGNPAGYEYNNYAAEAGVITLEAPTWL